MKGAILTGSMIGGLANTQEVIDFCAAKDIKPTIELIHWNKLDEVYKTLGAGNDRVVRYVIDMDQSLDRKEEEKKKRCGRS